VLQGSVHAHRASADEAENVSWILDSLAIMPHKYRLQIAISLEV